MMIVCRNQSDVNKAQGKDANICVDAPGLDIRVRAAKTIRVIACKTLYAASTKVEFSKIGSPKNILVDARNITIDCHTVSWQEIQAFLDFYNWKIPEGYSVGNSAYGDVI